MHNLKKTVKLMLQGNVGVWLASYLVQLLMVAASVFSTFLCAVLVDAFLKQLDKAAYLEKAIADLIAQGQGYDYLYTHVYIIGFWVLGAVAIEVLMVFLRYVLRANASSRINANMQNQLYQHLIRLPYHFYKEAKPGEFIQTCTSDIDKIRKFLIMQTSSILYALWMVVFCSVILFQINPNLALVSLCLFPVLFIYSFFFIKKLRKAYRAADDAEAYIVDRINDNLAGVRVIKAYGAEAREVEAFESNLLAYQKVSKYDRILESIFYSSSDIFIFLSRCLALVFSLYLCFKGEVTGGGVTISFTFVNMMVWPLRGAAETIAAFGQTLASSDRIQLLLSYPLEDTGKGEKAKLKGAIRFDHVSFHYPDDASTEVLKDISFSVAPGQTVALMGKTGSGKSTIYALLTRLYEVDKGMI